MQVTHPSPAQVPQLKALWKTCFGDSSAYIDHFFGQMFCPEHILIAVKDQTIVAMMMMLPAIYTRHGAPPVRGAYIYAVATLPAHRGQGIMTALHDQAVTRAEQAGLDFLTLVPATPSLFAMYQKLSYQTCSSLLHQTLTVNDYIPQAEVTQIAPLPCVAWCEQRTTYLASLRGSMALLAPAPHYSYEQITQFGGMILSVANKWGKGYLVGYRTVDTHPTQQNEKVTLTVRETNLSPPAFDAAVTALGADTGACVIIRHRPTAEVSARAIPYGMVRAVDDSSTAWVNCPPLYMNLMLD